MAVEAYRSLFFGPWEWDTQRVFVANEIWWEAVNAYITSDGSVDALSAVCGSPGEFAAGAHRLANWIMANGMDPYPLWDLFLAIDERMLGELIDIAHISRLSDRAILIHTRISCMAEPEADSHSPKLQRRRGRPVTNESAEINKFIINNNPSPMELATRFTMTEDAARKRIERVRGRASL